MLLWRISNHADLAGEGGLRASGRWHRAGRKIVYLAQNPATCLLERLVHLEIDEEDIPATYRTLKIEVPDALYAGAGFPAVLADGWQDDIELTQKVGNDWLAGGPCLLRVPCVGPRDGKRPAESRPPRRAKRKDRPNDRFPF